MPIYIAVVNQKGGAGKTATAVNLCGAFCRMGNRVLAVDADRQQTLSDWMQQRDPPTFPFAVVSMAHPKLHLKLPEIADPAGFDYVVVDCPPGGQDMDVRDSVSRGAALLADLVLVPLPPKPADFLAVARLKNLLIDLCSVKPNLIVAVVVNMKKAGEKMSRTARQNAFNLLEEDRINLIVLESEISERNVIAGAVADGVTILDQKSKISSERDAIAKASAEYIALAKEIQECLTTHSAVLAVDHA